MNKPARTNLWMMRRARRLVQRAWLALGSVWVCSGCFNLPKFAQYSLVDRPRILAVVADPPELTPGANASLSIMVGGAKEVSDVRWRVCSIARQFVSSTQYGDNTDDSGCPGDETPFATGERVTLSGAQTLALFASQASVGAALGGVLSPSALNEIRSSVGVAFTVEAKVVADGKELRALKRVLVSDNAHPGTDPPPPEFRFGSQTLRSVGDAAPFRCEPDSGSLRVQPGQSIALDPLFDGDEEPWLETYFVLDARGVRSERKEQAFYSWFCSQGELDHAKTRAPDRQNLWHAPSAPGCAQLWLVVRDGHGGETACRVAVSVGKDAACAAQP